MLCTTHSFLKNGCLQNTADLDRRYYLTIVLRSPCLREPELNMFCLLQLGMAVLPNHRVGIGIIAFHIVIDIVGRLSLESVATCWVYRGSPNFTELLSIMLGHQLCQGHPLSLWKFVSSTPCSVFLFVFCEVMWSKLIRHVFRCDQHCQICSK